MPRKDTITAPHDGTVTYVADGDEGRRRTYPIKAGAEIPRSVEFEGRTFQLRAVVYDVSEAA